MTVGERIRIKRTELNLSQDELAKKCGYKSRSSIQKIENSRDLPLNKVEKMANALGVSPGALMGWEEVESYVNDLEDANDVEVYRWQGYDAYMICKMLRKISQSKRDQVVDFVRFLYKQEVGEDFSCPSESDLDKQIFK